MRGNTWLVERAGWKIGSYLLSPIAIVIFWWLRDQELISDVPTWWLVGSVLFSSATEVVLRAWWTASPASPLRQHAWVAATAATTAIVIYSTGWGSLLGIGFAVGASQRLAQIPNAQWYGVFAWQALAIGIGEIAIATDFAPTVIDRDLSLAVAPSSAVCLACVLWILGTALAARNAAEAELIEHQQLLRVQASTDLLTGLANHGELEAALERVCATTEPRLLAFVDLDGFKEINDTYGHHVGDAVLKDVAARLRSVVRSSDLVARFGGDEFVILVTGHDDPQRYDVDALVARIGAALAPACPAIGHPIRGSVGAVVDLEGRQPAESLLREADHRMYTAKRVARTA